MPEPMLTNSTRLDQLIQDGKLMLSLDDAISLALENNLNIFVERFVPWIAETQLLKAQAGGVPQSNSTQQVVLGTSPSVSFDPIVSLGYSWYHANLPVNNPFISGTGTGSNILVVNQNSSAVNFGYTQGFHTGTNFSVTLNTARTATNEPDVFFNPGVQSDFDGYLDAAAAERLRDFAEHALHHRAEEYDQGSELAVRTAGDRGGDADFQRLLGTGVRPAERESAGSGGGRFAKAVGGQQEAAGDWNDGAAGRADGGIAIGDRPAKLDRGANHETAAGDGAVERHREEPAGERRGGDRDRADDADFHSRTWWKIFRCRTPCRRRGGNGRNFIRPI